MIVDAESVSVEIITVVTMDGSSGWAEIDGMSEGKVGDTIKVEVTVVICEPMSS